MENDTVKSVAILVGFGALVDFYLSYHKTHSLRGAIMGIVFGLTSTAFFVLLYYRNQ